MSKEVYEGMKQIADFLGRAESTVLKMIRAESLEARRIIWKRQGIWIANKKRLYEWWVNGVDEW